MPAAPSTSTEFRHRLARRLDTAVAELPDAALFTGVLTYALREAL